MSPTPTPETITLAGGCFWCLHAVYEQCEGVTEVESGYANGQVAQPSYEQVCRGDTGHAEVVRVRFDDARISLREILEIFYVIHDPTTRNRQGSDIGPQYRSGIYWSDPAHEAVVREVSAEADAAHRGRLVTELLPLSSWWPAEAYHQRYFANNPNQGYCAAVVAPKVEKFRRTFRARVRAA